MEERSVDWGQTLYKGVVILAGVRQNLMSIVIYLDPSAVMNESSLGKVNR